MKKHGYIVSTVIILVMFLCACSAYQNGETRESLALKLDEQSELLADLRERLEAKDARIDDLDKAIAVLQEENSVLLSEKQELSLQYDNTQRELDELKNGAERRIIEIREAFENENWEKVIDMASEMHHLHTGTEEDSEAQELAARSQENIEVAAALAAEEEARGYDTGITYEQLARTPDDYVMQKVKFYGKVVQVIEGGHEVQIRLAVNGDYDSIIFCEYESDIVSYRVLEDDYITVYGLSAGTISYQSTFGGQITIPAVYVSAIDQ